MVFTEEEAASWKPFRPNVLATGTPAAGESTLSRFLADALKAEHIDVGKFAISRKLTVSYGNTKKCYALDEDAVLDALEPRMASGGVVLEHHSSDWFPQRWIQLVVIVKAKTETLYDRMMERGYPEAKIRENIEAEIFGVSVEEARNSYSEAVVLEAHGDNAVDNPQHIDGIQKQWEIVEKKL